MKNLSIENNVPIKKIFNKFTWYTAVVILIIIAAVLTRFVNLGDRVMSHDEVNHVVPSYDLYSGVTYSHNPVSHGPLQFHFIALSYFLFGDNDFSARLPHALASIATILFILFAYRKYFGKIGSLITATLFLISPFLLFYGRYARNEAFIGLFLVLIFYALMRYFDKRKYSSLYLLTATLAFYFTCKETAYIHTAIMMIFFFVKMLAEIIHSKIIHSRVLLVNILLILLLGVSLFGSVFIYHQLDLSSIDNNAMVLQSSESIPFSSQLYYTVEILKTILPGLIPLAIGLVVIFSVRKYLQWERLSVSPAFNVFILITTLVLPLLAAFPVKFCGYDPTVYTSTISNLLDLIYLVFMSGVSIILGFTWQRKFWWKAACLFYAIFFTFYTTFFTNMLGALTGSIGSLGYWLAQQDVNRGNQPSYYYALLQMPFYEVIGLAGSLLAVIMAVFKKKPLQENKEENPDVISEEITEPKQLTPLKNSLSTTTLLLFWGISSLIAFSIAGEKMPWLTVHITIPFLTLAGAALGTYIDSIPWQEKSKKEKIVGILISFLIVVDFCALCVTLLGSSLPFQGKTQEQLQTTYQFLFRLFLLAGLLFLHRTYLKGWSKVIKKKTFVVAIFILLAAITCQSALRAAFVNDDYAIEYLVYAHAAPGPKEILDQVEKISRRLTGDLGIQVAYDNESLYPFWWYFREYPNRISFLENITRSLEDAPIILAGQANYDGIEPITRKNFYTFEYYRLWWPNQDYFNLTFNRIASMFKSADMRQALFNIWYYRDYSLYAQLNHNEYLETDSWLPSQKMRMYVRKDIAEKVWDLLSEDTLTKNPSGDIYASLTTTLSPVQFIGGDGVLNEPRGIDIAPDGSIYVADSKNNQIKHFSTTGSLLDTWGGFGSATEDSANAGGGTFYEPWDVAAAPDGTVYVSDTWNHRIQKFTKDGNFISMWGYYATDGSAFSYWGPRGITVDEEGNVYFADTGNKRIMIFDKNDHFITQIGSGGTDFGLFDEPVGIALDKDNLLYVADTWNSRVQVIAPDLELKTSTTISSWNIEGWYGQSTNNKPFIAVDADGNVFITDPEGSLILVYSSSGELLQALDIRGLSDDTITMPVDIEFGEDGTMWVSDATSNMVYGYTLPEFN